GTMSVLKNVTEIRHIGEELVRGQERLETAEEEVRTERDRLDLILRNVPNAIIVVDNDNQIISMNPAAERMFKPETTTPRSAHTAVANDARFTSFLAQLRLDPASSQRGEVILNDPRTDERLDMEVSATEVRDSRGAVSAIVSVMQDIGRLRELERRRLEQVLFDSEKLAATGRLAAEGGGPEPAPHRRRLDARGWDHDGVDDGRWREGGRGRGARGRADTGTRYGRREPRRRPRTALRAVFLHEAREGDGSRPVGLPGDRSEPRRDDARPKPHRPRDDVHDHTASGGTADRCASSLRSWSSTTRRASSSRSRRSSSSTATTS